MIRSFLLYLVLMLMPACILASPLPLVPVNKTGVEFSWDEDNTKAIVYADSPGVWARQQYKIWIEIQTDDKFSSLVAHEVNIPGFKVIPMQPERTQYDSSDAQTLLRAGWLLFANQPGSHTIELPPVDYILGGKVQRQYLLPLQHVSVQALPPYVPPTMPVGEINLSTELNGGRYLRQNSLDHWKIRLRSNSVLPTSLTPVLRQVKSGADIIFLPAETNRQYIPGVNGINSDVLYDIPFKTVSNGNITLPEIRLQYFNPESGKIVSKVYTHDKLFSLNQATWALLIATALYLLYLLFMRLYLLGRKYIEKQSDIKQAITAVHAAKDASELQIALRAYARSRNWRSNISMSGWIRHWPVSKKQEAEFSDQVSDLSCLSYAKDCANIDFMLVKEGLLRSLHI